MKKKEKEKKDDGNFWNNYSIKFSFKNLKTIDKYYKIAKNDLFNK